MVKQLVWLKATLLLKKAAYNTPIYMKTECLQSKVNQSILIKRVGAFVDHVKALIGFIKGAWRKGKGWNQNESKWLF